jgi:hypothetical protein
VQTVPFHLHPIPSYSAATASTRLDAVNVVGDHGHVLARACANSCASPASPDAERMDYKILLSLLGESQFSYLLKEVKAIFSSPQLVKGVVF